MKVRLPSKHPPNTLTNCTQNVADVQREIHRLLCRAPQDLHTYFADGDRFEVALHTAWAEANWFGLVQAWNLQECEGWNRAQDSLAAPVGNEEGLPFLRRKKERGHFAEDSPSATRAVVVQNVVDLLTIQNLSH